MSNSQGGTLYTGTSGFLKLRVHQHREGKGSVFCKRYKLTSCVYYELIENMVSAIAREKQIKAGSRQDKINLIEKSNPSWEDLYAAIPDA